MTRLIALVALAVTVLGIAAFTVTTERASAELPPAAARFDLHCKQIVAPNDSDNPFPGIGVVRCSLTIDIPDKIEWLPDTIKLTVFAAYRDVDGNNRPSHGDRLLCVRVVGPGGGTLFERCRPGIDIPPDLSLPGS